MKTLKKILLKAVCITMLVISLFLLGLVFYIRLYLPYKEAKKKEVEARYEKFQQKTRDRVEEYKYGTLN